MSVSWNYIKFLRKPDSVLKIDSFVAKIQSFKNEAVQINQELITVARKKKPVKRNFSQDKYLH